MRPTGLIIAEIPLFADLIRYFPLSIALKILCVKCWYGPIESPNHPSSEIFIMISKLDSSKIFPE